MRKITRLHFMRCLQLTLFAGISLIAINAWADEQIPKVSVRLVPLAEGYRQSAFGDDPVKSKQTAVYKAAASVGLDLNSEVAPLVQLNYVKGRLFYLFYNNASAVDPNTVMLVQRVHRRVTNYPAGENAEPQVQDSYLVEAFKCANGEIKRPDQHFGRYAIGNHTKRVIEKTFEIGVTVNHDADHLGKWPYPPKRLYHVIAGYRDSREAYDNVEYLSVAKWTIRLTIEPHGNYAFESPELGIRMIHHVTQPTGHEP